MLKMFCNGCSSLERVGSDSIYTAAYMLDEWVVGMGLKFGHSHDQGQRTILIEASVRLINFGRTSPSSPAASSSAASHNDKTVPTSCAKHSVHVRSVFGLPSVQQLVSHPF